MKENLLNLEEEKSFCDYSITEERIPYQYILEEDAMSDSIQKEFYRWISNQK